jgi:hypothetical protein
VDDQAIAAAIAARFTGLTPPTGEQDVALVTSDWPPQLGPTPAILVDPNPDDTYEWGPALTRHGLTIWKVLFLRAQEGDYGPRMNGLAKWRPVLRDRVVGQIQLGLAYIDWAELRAMGPAREITYAEIPYDGLELSIVIKTREQVAASA